MKIKWINIFAIIIIICLVKLLFKLPDAFGYFQLPWYFDDPNWALFFLAVICVTIIGIVKILSDR
jgi:hypothetical protein